MPSYSSPRARYCTRVVDELSHLAYTALLRRLVIFQQSAKSLVPRLKAKKTPGTFFKMTLNVDTEGNCSNDDAVCGRRLPHSFLGIHSTTLVYSRHCLENRCIDADNSDTVMEVYYSFMLWGVGREGRLQALKFLGQGARSVLFRLYSSRHHSTSTTPQRACPCPGILNRNTL